MNQNNNQPPSPEPADLAIQQVLQAERDAERAIADCEKEARDVLKTAQLQAQRIAARTNQRISMLQSRHGQKLDRAIRGIEQTGKQAGQANSTATFDKSLFNTVIEQLAAELTTDGSDSNEDVHT